MPEDLHELHEHAVKGQHDPGLAPVSLTMAILAVLVAGVTLVGHRAHTEEVLLQTKATDQWAYFQAKNIRRHNYDLFLDLLTLNAGKNGERADLLKKKYEKQIERYKDEQKEIEVEARKLVAESAHERKRADRFDLGEGVLEAALVLASITLLTRRRIFWQIGMALGLAGLVVALTGIWVH